MCKSNLSNKEHNHHRRISTALFRALLQLKSMSSGSISVEPSVLSPHSPVIIPSLLSVSAAPYTDS